MKVPKMNSTEHLWRSTIIVNVFYAWRWFNLTAHVVVPGMRYTCAPMLGGGHTFKVLGRPCYIQHTAFHSKRRCSWWKFWTWEYPVRSRRLTCIQLLARIRRSNLPPTEVKTPNNPLCLDVTLVPIWWRDAWYCCIFFLLFTRSRSAICMKVKPPLNVGEIRPKRRRQDAVSF